MSTAADAIAGNVQTNRLTAAVNYVRSRQAEQQRIPATFLLLIALYIVLTGDFPTIIQAAAFGLEGGAWAEFSAAMATSIAYYLLLIAAMVMLARHPLGILHPLLLAVVVWPIINGAPTVIQDFGGWAGILGGVPVASPFFVGIPSHDSSLIWTAIAKYNGVRILSLLCVYLGFWALGGNAKGRLPRVEWNSVAVRSVMLALVALSALVLAIFIYSRGGLNAHIASLGFGRFRALHNFGPVIVFTHLGEIALLVWVAVQPRQVKSPLFLALLCMVTFNQFIGNASRGGALAIPLTVGLIWALRTRRVPWRTAMILAPILFVSIGLMGAIRSSSWINKTAAETAASTGWADSFAQADEEIELRKSLSGGVPVVERGFEVTGGPLYGASYIGAVAGFIPRVVWKDKPRGSGSLYAQLFIHESEEGSALPIGQEAEMYWNFGIPGVILLSILLGASYRLFYNFMWRRYPDPFVVVLYVLFITRFQLSTTYIVYFEQSAGLLALCYLIVAFTFPRRTAEIPAWVQQKPVARPLNKLAQDRAGS